MTLQELVVDLKLNAENFAHGLESAMAAWESFGGSLLKIGAGLSAALTVPIVGIGQAAIKMGTQLQQAEIAFGTMLGSAELAGAYLEELKEFAAKTPFEFSELVPAAKRLMALGFAAEETIPMLKALGNAAAGLGGGAALIQRLGLALGQMRAKAKVSAEEMRQLAEAGIPAWEMLAKAMGKSTAELMKLSEKGQVSAAAAIPILIAGINEKFGGLMEGFMATAMGQYSNVKDQLGFVLADIGKALLPIAALLIEKFALPAVSALRDLAAWFSKLNDSTKMTIIAFAALLAAIGPVTLALGGMGMMYAPLIAGAARVSQALIPMFANIAAAIQTGTVGGLALAEKQLLGFVGVAVPALALVGVAFAAWQIPAVREKLIALWEVMKSFYSETIAPFVSDLVKIGRAFMETAAVAVESGLKTLLEDLNAAMRSDAAAQFTASLKDLGSAFGGLFSAIKPLWDVLGPLVAKMIEWSAFMAAGQIYVAMETLKNSINALTLVTTTWLKVLSTVATSSMEAATQGVSGLASALEKYLKPAIESQVVWMKVLADSFAMTFPRIAAFLGLVGEAYDKFRAKVGDFVDAATAGHREATKVTVSSLDQVQAAMEAAKKEYGEIQKAASTWDAAKKTYGATEAQLLAATEKLTAATKAHSIEMDKAGLNAQKVTEAVFATRKAYAEAQTTLSVLQDKKVKGLATDAQVIAATRKVTDAERARTAAMITLGEVAKRTGTDTASLLKEYAAVIPVVKTLEDREKALKEAVKQAEINYRNVARAYQDGTASARQLADAQVKLSIAQNAANPEHLIEWHKKQNDEQLKFNVKLGELSQKTAQARINWLDFTAALERGDAQKALESLNTTANMLGRNLSKLKIPEVLMPKGMHAQTEQTIRDQELLGTAIKTSAAEMQAAYDRELAAGRLAGKARIEVQRNILLQIQKEEEDAGRKLTDGQQKQLDTLEKQLEEYGKKAKSFWVEFGQAIQGIMMNWAADIGRGLWETMLGKDRKDFNKGLDQQASDLNTSLDERTQEWKDYQSEIASSQEAAQKEYEDTLAEESAALQASLDERVQDYVNSEAETVQKLDEVRAEYAKSLAGELSDLAESLEERRVEYEDYVQEIADKLAETRQTHAKQLAEQLSDLEDSLNDQRRSYDEYVSDVNKKLSRVGEDYTESIDDETKQTAAGIADRRQEYARDEEDTLEKIARLKKAGKKENSEEVQDLRKSLRRKQEDLDEYVRENMASLTEYKDDAKKRLDRETSDIKSALQQRTDEYSRYVAENQAKRNEAVAKNRSDLAADEADLAKSLAERTTDWTKYLADNAKKVAEAHVKYTEELAKEENDLAVSLAKKKASLDAYILEVNQKWANIQAAALASLVKEEADLAASLANQQLAYDKYVEDVAKKLDGLKELYRSAWDEIGGMVVGAFEKAGESVMTFISTYLMDKLLNSFKKGGLVDAIKDFGGWLKGIFTGAEGTGEGPAGFGVPSGVSQGIGAGTGEAGSVIGAAGSAASTGVMGMVNMISGIASAAASIVALFQNYGLGKDMEQSAQTLIKVENITRDTLNTANLYWPNLKDTHAWITGPQFDLLKEINDSIASMHLMQGPNFANIIDRLDTLVLATSIPLAANTVINPLSPSVTGPGGVAISSSVTVQGNVIGNREYLDQMSRDLSNRLRLQGAIA